VENLKYYRKIESALTDTSKIYSEIMIKQGDVNIEIDYNSVIEKLDFFRTIHVWPLNDVINYKGWLDNFKNDGERKIAARILDFFIFYPRPMIKQMLKTVIGYCGEFLQTRFPDWQHDDFFNRCIYSFIPGETNNPTDSGHIYVRKLRNDLHIPQERIVYNDDLFSLLEDSKDPIPVIFVDDFVGSGAQCITAWNGNGRENNKNILKEMACNSNHVFIYAPLVCNYIGYNNIMSSCSGLSLITCHILKSNYNLFDPSCICWKNEKKDFLEGTKLILTKSKELGIPFTNGKETIDVKGFEKQGLAIAFDDDGIPDAILPFFYWCTDNWVPLINKDYSR
jgi:hypothetical protein